MAIIFLTSSPSGPLDGSRLVNGLDDMNHFTELLGYYWKNDARNLMITAFPADYEASDEMTAFFSGILQKRGFSAAAFDLADNRNWETMTREKIQSYDVIWLGGGHVPTQNEFFRRMHLREKLEGFSGIIIGISAGTMNSADLVYSEPEEPGEAADPDYQRFLTGLNLTKHMILPHYQMVKDKWLDGKRLYEDIVFPDSMGREILNFPDGTFLLSENGKETVFGEAWVIHDGRMDKICETGEQVCLDI